MKAILLYAKSGATIAPVKAADFGNITTGQDIAAPGMLAYVATNTGRPVPANIQLIRFRS